jgi:response regulator RpfG family c-di-GMP phosphodiesterase
MGEQPARAPLSNLIIGDLPRARVLLVDDEETIRLAFSRFLRSRGYEVETAATGAEALERLAQARFGLMICDIRMPGMTGIELIPRARSLDPDLSIMMLTAVNDPLTADEAHALGAMEYLTKPIGLPEFEQAVQRVLHRHSLEVEHRNVERLLHDEVARRTAFLEHEKEESAQQAVQALAEVVHAFEAKDPYFVGQSFRVTALADAMSEVLAVTPEQRTHVVTAARLHDVGRVALRESVLTKPGPLTPDEFEHVKDHVRLGVEMLSPLAFASDALDYVRDHHEHWDGSGYPRGTSGRQISVGGRILCAADAFVALTSRRAYRDAMASDDAVRHLAEHAGTLLDPGAFQALRLVVTERRVLGLTAD